MELSEEVSIKIKSAIRARLKELGIVWDRELPDYVMVLIANKKTKEQMEKDLMIFLGSHTAGFTAWLHNVLKKLEECAISRGLTKKKEEDKKSKTKRKPFDENHQEIKKQKSSDSKEDRLSLSESETEEGASNQLSPDRIDEEMDSDVSDSPAPTVATSGMKLMSSANQREGNEPLGPICNSTVESKIYENNSPHNKVSNGFANRVEERPKPKEKIEISWSNEKLSDAEEHLFKDQKSSFQLRSNRERSSSRNPRKRSRSKSRNRYMNPQDFDEEKHVSVLKRTMKENGHRGQERKPYRESRNIYRRKSSEERRNGYGIKSRPLGNGRGEKDRNMRNRSRSRDMEEERLPSLVKVTPRPVRHPSMQPSSNLILKAVAEAQKSIATSSLPQPDDKLQKKEEKDPISRKAVYRKKKIPKFHRENISVTLLNDRVIADKIRDTYEDPVIYENNNKKKQENNLNGAPEVERFTISLMSDDNDSLAASDFEETNEEKRVDEESLAGTDQNEVQMDEPMEISSTTCTGESVEGSEVRNFPGQKFDRRRLGPRVVPDADTVLSCLAPSEDSIQKTIVNENAYAMGDGKLDENGKVIKCKFWPNCEAGSSCKFFHPAELCRALPNCKFGQKCLYFHPVCKFGEQCLNVTCPYMHTPANPVVKAKIWTKVPLAPSNGQICMYYPNCKKPFCPYQHIAASTLGIPCKFGPGCSKLGCDYDHGRPKNPYKWVAQSSE